MTLDEAIRAVQAKLGVEVDGRPGPQTWAAIHAAIVGKKPVAEVKRSADEVVVEGDKVDARSERVIATLQARVRPYGRALVQRAAGTGITVKLISGLRSYEEQAELYAKGRTKPGPKVTNAPPGYSNHNFGIAFDIGVFAGTKYLAESPLYKTIGALGTELGLEWGGNWKTIKDQPHFQLRPKWAQGMPERAMLAELRRRKAAGKDAYA